MKIFFFGTRDLLLSALFTYGCGLPEARTTTNAEIKQAPQVAAVQTAAQDSGSNSANGVYRIRPSTPEAIDKVFGLLEANKIAYSSVPEGDVIVKLGEVTKIKLEKQIQADAQIIPYETYPESTEEKFDPRSIVFLPEEQPISDEENEKNLIKIEKQINEARSNLNLFGKSTLRSYDPEVENSDLNLAEGVTKGAVDLSTSGFFPLIMQQKGNTCQSFSTGYYSLTFMNAKANKIILQKAKIDMLSMTQNSCDPYFIYSQMNMGKDNESRGSDAIMAAHQIGCASYADYGVPAAEDLLTKIPTASQMLKAMQTVRLNSGSETFFSTKINANVKDKNGKLITDKYYAIKQITALIDQEKLVPLQLNVYKDFYTYPTKNTTEYVSDNGVIYAQPGGEHRGGHAVTVVGYNNNLKYTPKDAKGNTLKDTKGKAIVKTGALLLANSWGSDWGVPNSLNIAAKKGFLWLGYDYLADDSASLFAARVIDGGIDRKPELIGLFTVKDTTQVTGIAGDYRYSHDVYSNVTGTTVYSDAVLPTASKTMAIFPYRSLFRVNKSTVIDYPLDLTKLINANTGIAIIKSTDTEFLKSFKLADISGYPKYETDQIKDNQLLIRISKLAAKCGKDNGKYFTIEPINRCSVGSAAIANKSSDLGWEWQCGTAACKAYKNVSKK